MIRSLFRSLASDPKYEKYSEVFIRLNNDYISHELPFSKFEMLVNFITAVIRGESDENIDEMHAAIYAVATVQPCGAAVALPCDGAAVALPCDEAAVALPRDEAAAAQPRDGAAAAQPRDEESDDSDATEIYNDDDGFIAAVIEAQRSLDAQFPNVWFLPLKCVDADRLTTEKCVDADRLITEKCVDADRLTTEKYVDAGHLALCRFGV